MPSARTVVEDSDEDEDVLSPVKDGEPVESANDAGDAGTNSTDQLKRDRRDAHDALFEYEASRQHGLGGTDTTTTPLESPTVRTKRRRTADDTASSALPSVQQKRSKSATQVFKSAAPRSSHEQQLHDDAATAWNMRGSLLQDFEQHEPVTMFVSNAYTGSTVPDNTYTQQRLIRDAISANEQPGCGSVHSSTLQSDGSLRSSAFRTTQATNKSPSALKSSDSTKEGSSSQLLHGKGSPLKQESKAESQGSMPPSINGCTPSKCTRPSQSVQPSPRAGSTIATSRKPRSTTPLGTPPKDFSTPGANEVDLSLPGQPPTQQPTTQTMHPDRFWHAADVMGSAAEVVGSPTFKTEGEIVVAAPASTLTKKRRRNEVEALEQLNNAETRSDGLDPEEIAAIGLPEERYQPRPSRSRSAQVASVAAGDRSIDSGKAGKQRSKRRKTVDADDTSLKAYESPDTHRVEVISSMGFTPTRAKKALAASNGNLEAAVDNLIEKQLSRDTQDLTETDTAKAPAERINPDTEHLQIPTARKAVVSVQIPLARSRRSNGEQPLFVHEDDLQEPSASESEEGEPSAMDAGDRSLSKGNATRINQDQPPIATNTQPGGLPLIKRGPGRPRKKVIDVLTEDEAAEMEARGSLHDAPDDDDEREDLEHVEQPETTKRGRGRPRSTNAKKSHLKIHHDECSTLQQQNKATEEVTASCDTPVLQELDANCTAATTSAPQGHEGAARTPSHEQKPTQTVTPASSPLQPAPPSIPPVTPTKQRTTGTQHSPISKGKVPYRVGLSRHARIPSLLRSMKK